MAAKVDGLTAESSWALMYSSLLPLRKGVDHFPSDYLADSPACTPVVAGGDGSLEGSPHSQLIDTDRLGDPEQRCRA